MTYATGTLAATANPGPGMYADIEPTLLAAGFTLEDTVVIGSRTHKILKSLGASNSYGLTWFLDVSYPTTGVTGGMLMTPFEDYNAATDVAYRGPYSASSATIEGTYYSRFGASGSALETNWVNTSAYSSLDNPLSTGATGWWLSATTDRVIFMSTAASGELHYVGFFEPTADHAAAAGASMFPLIVTHFASASTIPASASSGSTAVVFTRVPPLSTIAWGNQGIIDLPYAQLGGAVGGGGNFAATAKTYLARRPVTMGYNTLNNSSASTATGGMGPVGHLIDVVNTWTDGAVARGDDLTDTSANVWIGTDDANNVGLWFKAV
jgi:hypothetical protein